MKHRAKIFLILASLVTVTIHVMNKLTSSFSTIKDLLSCKDNQYYEWRFGKIRYLKKGTGAPLLLIHDLLAGSSLYEYKKLIDSLSKTNTIYAIDLLGYGLSDKPNMTYTNYLYLQLIHDFIKNVIGKKTNVVVSGDSAPITIMLAHNDPELLNKMILINPQSIYQLNQIPSKRTKILKLLIEFPVLGTFIYNLLTTREHFEKTFVTDYFYNPAKADSEFIDSYLESSHNNNSASKYSFASYVGRYTNVNILHALKELNHSIYIISGKEKENVMTLLDNYLYYNNSIEAVTIEKTKHLPQLEAAEDVLAQIELFLS